MQPYLVFKDTSRTNQPIIVPRLGRDWADWQDIRCPLCAWQPRPSSRWSCLGARSPEPGFAGCGTVWNTFATRGRCPGCAHQWRWTSCLQCGGWSLHDDWYEQPPDV